VARPEATPPTKLTAVSVMKRGGARTDTSGMPTLSGSPTARETALTRLKPTGHLIAHKWVVIIPAVRRRRLLFELLELLKVEIPLSPAGFGTLLAFEREEVLLHVEQTDFQLKATA
jgi:hypothetical protein